MEQKRVYKTGPSSNSRYTASNRPVVSYSRRPITQIRTDSVDGIRTRRPGMIPGSQQEYIDSLTGLPPKLSRFARQHNQNFGDSFAPKVQHLFQTARNRFLAIKSVMPALVILFFVFISIVGMMSVRSGDTAEADRSRGRSSVESQIDTGDEISERRPTNMQTYQVSEDLPRILYIDNMGLSARVRRVGVGTQSELRLPSNIYDVGWYESSVKPGEPGAVVLTGHASGPSKPGIFHDLTELKPGDEFELETGGGKIYRYYVAKMEAFKDDDPLDPMLASAVPGTPGLNLITETGTYDSKANTYDQRLVIYAVQKNVRPSANKAQAD